ncbi:MAG TPA: oligopeptide/dipeptide ABC transporter ATP-binding protein [Ornithinibacter sp.]|nr:oligopeptide/dipeptide ABC transporter ATP-binding protein [Ornithinibacter sp.]
MSDVLLEASGLTKSFPVGRNLLGRPTGWRHAVRGVDLRVARGETLAVVGESGAGKSTVGRLLLRLVEPDGGRVRLDGIDVLSLRAKQLRALRKRMQMIFQDPYASLDPKMVVEDAVAEPLTVHFGMTEAERRRRVRELLDRVGIGEHQAERYPYEFSGGQLQRIAIARALAVEPDLIVCDEPVAALDVSIRAQVVNLLHELQRERGVAYVFISHDLSLVRLIAQRVAVMYQGSVVEDGATASLFANPRHPYTRALLDVIPVADPRRRADRTRRRAARPPADGAERTPAGCAYAPHCPEAMETCWSEPPVLGALADGTRVCCHLHTTTPADLTSASRLGT